MSAMSLSLLPFLTASKMRGRELSSSNWMARVERSEAATSSPIWLWSTSLAKSLAMVAGLIDPDGCRRSLAKEPCADMRSCTEPVLGTLRAASSRMPSMASRTGVKSNSISDILFAARISAVIRCTSMAAILLHTGANSACTLACICAKDSFTTASTCARRAPTPAAKASRAAPNKSPRKWSKVCLVKPPGLSMKLESSINDDDFKEASERQASPTKRRTEVPNSSA
mmetsp:Transcript_116881/g.335396  ORF Transcript_116881/g.335396 Transcript_116881/m.335396 type:complete len:227 (+) Transcript_116881:184-864(+)